MADVMRTCSRTGCRWPASASLSYRYATSQAWLLDLAEEPDPSLYDLCPHHAGDLTVPRGWTCVDERTLTAPVQEPSAADIVARAANLRATVDAQLNAARPARVHEHAGGPRRNRYQMLAAELPALAAQLVGEHFTAPLCEEPPQPPSPVPSRDLAPVGFPESPSWTTTPPSSQPASPPAQERLAVRVEDLEDGRDAIVVSIDRHRRADDPDPDSTLE